VEVRERFYNVTFHQLSADEAFKLLFSGLSHGSVVEINVTDERDNLYGDCAELADQYGMIAVIKE
jgi:hypothetical protein